MPDNKQVVQEVEKLERWPGDKVIQGTYGAEVWLTSNENVEQPRMVMILNRNQPHPDDLQKEKSIDIFANGYKPKNLDNSVSNNFTPENKEGNWRIIKIQNFKINTYNNGFINLNSDGNIIIETNNNAKVYINKNGEVKIKGSLNIDVDTNVNLKTKELVMEADNIKIGSKDSKQPAVLGFRLQSYLAKMYSWMVSVGGVIGIFPSFESPPREMLSDKTKVE